MILVKKYLRALCLLSSIVCFALSPSLSSAQGNDIVASLTQEEIIVAQSFSYQSEYVSAQNERIGKQCDKIIKNLEKRYGKPKKWTRFPVFYSSAPGGSVAGYTSYIYPTVSKVVVYQSFETSNGGTLDHELTHAFFFYYFQTSFDLFLNEGLAQNSEYKRRNELRNIVYRRYSNGEFWSLDRLYGRDAYDGSLLMYHESFSLVDFLIARGGSRWFVAFANDLIHNTKNIDVSLQKYYGYKNISELDSEWIKYIQNGQDRSMTEPIF